MSRRGTFIETETRLVSRGQGKRIYRSNELMSTEHLFGVMEKFVNRQWWRLHNVINVGVPLTCTLKWWKWQKFLCIYICHNKKVCLNKALKCIKLYSIIPITFNSRGRKIYVHTTFKIWYIILYLHCDILNTLVTKKRKRLKKNKAVIKRKKYTWNEW